MNFIDGERSILDIAHALYAEYGAEAGISVNPADIKEYVMKLVDSKSVKIKE